MKRRAETLAPYKNRPTINNDQASRLWNHIYSAIKHIYHADPTDLSFEELHRYGYTLVMFKRGEFLYRNVKAALYELVEDVALQVEQYQGAELLDALLAKWNHHQIAIKRISDILMYLNRSYVEQTRSLSTQELGISAFGSHVFQKVANKVRSILLKTIQKSRAREIIDTDSIRKTTKMLVDLGNNTLNVYEKEFEFVFLKDTRAYYKAIADKSMDKDVPKYLQLSERLISEELARIDKVLAESSRPKVSDILNDCLIYNHALALVNMEDTGVLAMLKEDRVIDLRRMYTLFCSIKKPIKWKNPNIQRSAATSSESCSLSEILREMLKFFAFQELKLILTKDNETIDSKQLVSQVIMLRSKLIRICQNAFNNDKQFVKGMKDAFEQCLNGDRAFSDHLVIFLDDKMRSGFKGATEDEIDRTLDDCIALFRYLGDKDIFENDYRQMFAKRLLSGKSVSDEAERSMIIGLKIECGAQFTTKMEGMFQDLQQSRTTLAQFVEYMSDKESSGPDIAPLVLTQGHWPPPQYDQCTLPRSLRNATTNFSDYYISTHSGRRLAWITEKGTAELKTLKTRRKHELVVTTYQMCLLLCFNHKTKYTFRELMENTKIDRSELTRHLLSLCTTKYRILLKSSKGKHIEDTDTFQTNDEFTHKMLRVRIPTISKRSTLSHDDKSNPSIPIAVQEDRKHVIDATIVRLMKTRQSMIHSELISEVIHHLGRLFQPSPTDIKKRLENLIERDYLERDEANPKRYNYVA